MFSSRYLNNNAMDKDTENQAPNATDQESEKHPVEPNLKQPGHIKHARKLIYGYLILLVLAGACGYFVYRYNLHQSAKVPATNASVTSTKKGPNIPVTNTNTAPAVETTVLGDVKSAYLTLPLTKDQASTNPINGPGQSISTASGHYLLRDPRGFSYSSSNEGGKLLYDGKSIYDGPLLWEFTLSSNGEHYAYDLDTSTNHTGGNYEIYLDGKLIRTVPDSNGVYDLAIADNGKDYAFTTGQPKATWGDTDLVKDGNTIYTNPNGIRTIYFDSKLQHYIAATNPTASNQYDLALNGQTILTNLDFAGTIDPPISLSQNGQHYLYANGGILYLDGKEILQPKDTAAMGVSDNGDYAVVNPLASSVTTSKTSFTLSSQFAQGCNPGCGGSFPMFSMSNDGQHFVYGTQTPNLWNLDGATVTPTGTIEGVEFVNDTLYLYRWDQ
jgi:hypothetical protein